MNTFIVRYAPLDHGAYALQNLKTAKIYSKISDKETIKTLFEKRCDEASSDIPTYQGMFVQVETLEEFLNSLPTDTF